MGTSQPDTGASGPIGYTPLPPDLCPGQVVVELAACAAAAWGIARLAALATPSGARPPGGRCLAPGLGSCRAESFPRHTMTPERSHDNYAAAGGQAGGPLDRLRAAQRTARRSGMWRPKPALPRPKPPNWKGQPNSTERPDRPREEAGHPRRFTREEPWVSMDLAEARPHHHDPTATVASWRRRSSVAPPCRRWRGTGRWCRGGWSGIPRVPVPQLPARRLPAAATCVPLHR